MVGKVLDLMLRLELGVVWLQFVSDSTERV